MGYSVFLCHGVGETSSFPCFALGAGLGVLKAGATGVNALTSLRAGPELAIGPDFSIALTAGVHREDTPKPEFTPGSALPTGATTIETQTGFAFGMGVVLNFSPSFLKGAGIIAAGGN